MTNSNPLLEVSQLKNYAVPFNKIKNEHYLTAIKSAIDIARKNIEAITTNKEEPTFENSLLALEKSSEMLDSNSRVFFNMLSAHTDDEKQALVKEISPIISHFSSEVQMNPELFERIKALYDKKDSLGLNQEQMQLLDNTYKSFVRNGALLDEKQKEEIKSIDQRMAVLSPEFSENVLNDTNSFQMWIDNEEDLAGLPESVVEAAKHAGEEADASKKGQALFTLHAPSFIPFVTFSEKRELREKMYRAYGSRALKGDKNNREICIEMANLRHKRAQILGFKSHAHFKLEERMAQKPETVMAFLNRLLEKSRPAAERDIEELKELKKSMGHGDDFMPWDYHFYAEKLKAKKFDIDQEKLRPYFKLENVINGAFEHAKKLFKIDFRKTDDYPTYHEDVSVYEVYKEGSEEYIGLFFTDFFPRKSKRGGAWMTSYLEQGIFQNKNVRPIISIVCNFTKPTPKKPSLLTFEEVTTLFHEFGHSLHGLLSQCNYRSLSGTNVYWDFVELPSQLMENWCLERETLELFAKHYETGETIPSEWIDKLKALSHFQAGYRSLRQVNFAMLDMAWHSQDPSSIKDVTEFEAEATRKTQVLPKIEGTNQSVSFAHIFAGGYSAGYYSYKWAEVLDADAFEYFKEQGLYNEKVAQSLYDNILTRGGTEHPMELYKKFRGREPDADALLRRDGLI